MANSDKRGLFKRLTEALFEDVEQTATAASATAASATAAAASSAIDDVAARLAEDRMPAAPAPGRRMLADAAHAAFQARIADALQGDRPMVAGKMQFVDLDAIKADLGGRWEGVVDKVHQITEKVLQRRLTDRDAYVAYDGNSYLLLFADLTEAQARVKAMAIANEIRQRLMGEFGLPDRYWVRAFVGDLAAIGAGAPTPDLDALSRRLDGAPEILPSRAPDQLLDQMGQGTAPPGPRHSAQETIVAQAKFETRITKAAQEQRRGSAGKMQLLQLDEIRAEMGDRWQELAAKVYDIAEQVMSRRLAPTDVFAPYEDGSYLLLFAELDEEEARLKAAAIAREIHDRLLGELARALVPTIGAFVTSLAAVTASSAGPPTLMQLDQALVAQENVAPPPDSAMQAELRHRLGEVGISYRPTLFAPRGMIPIFGAWALRLDQANIIHHGAAAYPAHDPPVAFEIDRAVLQLAIKDARDLLGKSVRALVTVPLRLLSLIDHGGGQLVDLCRAQPPAVRRLMVIELFGLLPEAPTKRLEEGVTALQPFCRAVTVTVPPGFAEFDRLARYRVSSVGIELAGLDPAARERLTGQLPGFARSAHTAGMTAHLHGIDEPALFAAARSAGFDYLNGPAVADELPRPVAMHRYPGAP